MKQESEMSAYRPIRCSAELDDTLGKLAAQRNTSKSEVLRDLVEKGLVSIGAKTDENYLQGLIRHTVQEAMKPQVERLAAISAKAAQISGAAFFMGVYAAMLKSSPLEQEEIQEAAGQARELGIQYLKLKDRDIDAFIREGVKTVAEENGNGGGE